MHTICAEQIRVSHHDYPIGTHSRASGEESAVKNDVSWWNGFVQTWGGRRAESKSFVDYSLVVSRKEENEQSYH